jgi:hypothetical protein
MYFEMEMKGSETKGVTKIVRYVTVLSVLSDGMVVTCNVHSVIDILFSDYT